MSVALKKWLAMNVMSYMIFVYIGIFVNLFIWEKYHLIFDVAWYNMLQFFTWSLAFTAAGYLLSKYTVRLLLAISAVSGGTAFLLLSFVELDNRLLWIALIGVPVGIMYGFFSAAHNLSVSLCGTSAELGQYFTAAGSIQQLVTLVIPMASATIIHYFGYSSTFAMMLIFFACMLGFSLAMPKISLRAHIDLRERSFLARLFSDDALFQKSIRWLAASSLAAGVFLQFQQLFMLIFTFSVTENKFWIAGLNASYTLATMAGLFFYRKMRMTEQLMLLIGCLLLACGFLIVLFPAKPLLIVSNLLTAVGMYYFSAAWNTHQFRLIKSHSPSSQALLIIWRESLLCVTRIATLFIVMSVKEFRGGLFIALIVLSLICLMAVPYFENRAKKTLERSGQPAETAAIPLS